MSNLSSPAMHCRLHTPLAVIGIALLSASLGAQARVLTADDYARAEKALGFATAPLVSRMGVQPNWLPDGRFWYRVRQPDGASPAILVDPGTGTRTNCATTPAACAAVPTTSQPAAGAGRRRGGVPETFSPDGKKAAFIRDWNLWVRDVATNAETQLTTDGVKDFGYATDNAGWVHSDRRHPHVVARLQEDRDVPAGSARRRRDVPRAHRRSAIPN